MNDPQPLMRLTWLLIAAWFVQCLGCAAVTSPVANGVPAHLLPEALMAEPVEDLEPIPWSWLRIKPPEIYRLGTGDILGVYVEGALGKEDQLPPINFPQLTDAPPSIGYPVPVSEDGTVLLPLVKKVKVAGLSIDEAQEAVERAYTAGKKQYLRPEETRIIVNLVRPRQARILVIREDAPNTRPSLNDPTFRLFGSAPSLGQRSQGTGAVLEVPEVEADLMRVLTQTGGLPGPTAEDEVIIYRGYDSVKGVATPDDWALSTAPISDDEAPSVTRIKLRIKPGERRPFDEDDIRLRSGDIVYVPPRTSDVYYTGGLLPAREVPLPRDNDLRMVEAILRVGGSVVSGGRIVGNFSNSVSLTSGIESSNPSLLSVIRRAPNGEQIVIRVDLNRALRDHRENLLVMPGDVLVLQETPAEAVSRYFTNAFNIGIFSEMFNRGSATGTATLTLP